MPEMLTDAELLALPNGDPLLGKLTGDEARRRTVLQTGKPLGNPETRGDSNMFSIDHDKIALGISNWASKLSPSLQRPAAMLASFPADALASLAEMFSAPEVVGTAKPVMRGAEALASAVGGVRGATAPFAETLLTKKLGLDPDAIDLQATRLRLQAARSRTRQASKAAASEAPARPAAPATPVSASPVSAAPETPATAPSTPAPRAGSASAPPSSLKAAAAAAKLKLSPKEFEAFRDLVQQGYDPDKVLKAIQGQRAASALQQRLGTPTNAEVDVTVADRNATGRWPQDRH